MVDFYVLIFYFSFPFSVESVWTIVENEELSTEIVVDVHEPKTASNYHPDLEYFMWPSDVPIVEDYFIDSEE